MTNPRVQVAQIIYRVAHEGNNLDEALESQLKNTEPSSNAYIKAACYGVLRFYPRLLFFLSHLIDKPVRNKEKIIECLLLTGLYELYYMKTAEHACVSETVSAAVTLKKQWAKGLINAVLRSAIRERETIEQLAEQSEGAATSHPKWLLKRFKHDWPEQLQQIVAANNTPGPLTLRVNRRKGSTTDYLAELQQAGIVAQLTRCSDQGIECEQAVDVTDLPGFEDGKVSIQDQAAQLAAGLLDIKAGQRILDACAAPGGKTGHILETEPGNHVVALDKKSRRLEKVTQNLNRLGLEATTLCADAADVDTWWDGEQFDRILLDAPCSGTGVIRRHPDIKLLRSAEDVQLLTQLQQKLLDSLWPLLKSGGMLLYSTCSILADENERQIQSFLARQADAHTSHFDVHCGHPLELGLQILPGQDNMDGFYYARLQKQN